MGTYEAQGEQQEYEGAHDEGKASLDQVFCAAGQEEEGMAVNTNREPKNEDS